MAAAAGARRRLARGEVDCFMFTPYLMVRARQTREREGAHRHRVR
jgi:hypothetical protein